MNTETINMKTIALLLAISAVTSGLEWTSLRTKWNTAILDYFRWNSYFEIPLTVDNAISEGYIQVTGINALDLNTYCYADDGQFCALYDGNNRIVGFQAGILTQDVDPTGNIYDTSKFDVYKNVTIFGEKYLIITIYTTNPETLEAGGSSDSDKYIGTEGIWIESKDTYVEIPRYAKDLDSAWTEEACIGSMGTHYYHNMTTSTNCADFFPMFLLYQGGELAGCGVQAFGSCTIKSRSWCEWVPSLAIKPTIPTTPQCLIDWVADYGTISRHFYFVPEPWNIQCE